MSLALGIAGFALTVITLAGQAFATIITLRSKLDAQQQFSEFGERMARVETALGIYEAHSTFSRAATRRSA